MLRRPAARVLVIDPAERILLFHYVHRGGSRIDRDYWAVPGAGVEPGETFEEVAIRELREATGIEVAGAGIEIARREFIHALPDGRSVVADERYFLVEASSDAVSRPRPRARDAVVVVGHRWWSRDEMKRTTQLFWPDDLPAIVRSALGRLPSSR